MANFVLDKGFKVEGTDAAVAYRFVGWGTQNWTVDVTPTLGASCPGVIMENVDAAKVTTGKVIANVRVLGIAPVKAAAALTRGAQVTTDATGQAIAAGAGNAVLGIAMESAAIGDIIDVLIVPGGTF